MTDEEKQREPQQDPDGEGTSDSQADIRTVSGDAAWFVVVAMVLGGAIGMALFAAGVISAVSVGLLHAPTLLFLFGSLVVYAGLVGWQQSAQFANPTVRRTLYGYNVFLMCGLLIVALGILNVLTYKFGAEKIDLTSNQYYSLADQTKEVLAALDRPVQVNVLFPRTSQDLLRRDEPYVEARLLLEDMLALYRTYSPQLRIAYIDPYADPTKGRQLQQQFPDVTVPAVVVVYGEGKGAQHAVLKYDDLIEPPPPAGFREPRPAQIRFRGEAALTSALIRLREGDRPTKVYFTQGHGELDLEDSSEASQRGLGLLRQRLTDLGILVAPLDLAAQAEVPEDATVVVVAGPQQPFEAAQVKALRDYMGRGNGATSDGSSTAATGGAGRLLLMPDFVYNTVTKGLVPTGLEDFLRDYQVDLEANRVLQLNVDLSGRASAVMAVSVYPDRTTDHPITRAMGSPAVFYECRGVKPLATAPGGAPAFQVQSILRSGPNAWGESSLDPGQPVRPDDPSDTPGPVSVGVAVTRGEGSASPHGMLGQDASQQEQPVMVVLGDAEFAANRQLQAPGGSAGLNLVLASINWLRGRMELVSTIPPKTRETLELKGTQSQQLELVWKPTFFLLVMIVAAGLSVWMVRRQV